MLPDSRATAEALRTRELTVVVDSFLTDSAREAHVVLPTTTMLEDDDLLGAYGNHWIHELRPVVRPPEGVRTDLEIVHALAPRLGIGAPFTDTPEIWKRRMLAKVAPLGASLEDLRSGRPTRNPFSTRVLFEDRKFPTATGRVNLVKELDPEPPRATSERPLLLMAQSTERSQGSQWQAPDQAGLAVAVVHPDAAQGFLDGGAVRIESEIGAMEVVLRFDSSQRRDVLLMEKGGWFSAGRAANALVPARLTDAGECAVYLDTPVRITAKL
jgi:anaerobic selenocysteine-containing dehydrogenase